MKTRIKITLTLAVGISLLISSMGTASASPHYTNWGGSGSLKAEATTVENTKVKLVKDLDQTSGFSHHADVDKVQKKERVIESIKIAVKETTSQGTLDVGLKNVERPEASFEALRKSTGSDHDNNDATMSVSNIWTTGGTASVWTSGGVTSIWTSGGTTSIWTSGGITSIWTSGGVTSIWTSGGLTSIFANFSPFIF